MVRRRPRGRRARTQQPPSQEPRLEDPCRSLQPTRILAAADRCCNDRLSSPRLLRSVWAFSLRTICGDNSTCSNAHMQCEPTDSDLALQACRSPPRRPGLRLAPQSLPSMLALTNFEDSQRDRSALGCFQSSVRSPRRAQNPSRRTIAFGFTALALPACSQRMFFSPGELDMIRGSITRSRIWPSGERRRPVFSPDVLGGSRTSTRVPSPGVE